jgi:lantibiotic modifying enzyme
MLKLNYPFNLKPMNIYVPKQLTQLKQKYFWAEFISHDTCKSKKEVENYWRRAGILLAVCYILGFTDGHMENIIACRDQPILVDCETILAQYFDQSVNKNIERKIGSRKTSSWQLPNKLDGWFST